MDKYEENEGLKKDIDEIETEVKRQKAIQLCDSMIWTNVPEINEVRLAAVLGLTWKKNEVIV